LFNTDFSSGRNVGHPAFAESLIPFWGSGREAIADWQEGDKVGAALNGALAVSDLFLAGSVVKGLSKGGLKLAGSHTWDATRKYLRKTRKYWGVDHPLGPFLKTRQEGHHWLIPRNGWGEAVPDVIKNQMWNIKPMRNKVIHGRIRHPVGELPRFNPVEGWWHGTPAWSKVALGEGVVQHPTAAAWEAATREDD